MHSIKRKSEKDTPPEKITMKFRVYPFGTAQKCSELPILLGLGGLAVGAKQGQPESLGYVSYLNLQVSVRLLRPCSD